MSFLDDWRKANPTQDYCQNCRTLGNVGPLQQPSLTDARYCYLCLQTYPESINPQFHFLLRTLSIILNELKPPKKPRTPRRPRGKLSVMPMAPRQR